MHGVDAMIVNFSHVRGILIPPMSERQQEAIEQQYLMMSKCHDRAMAVKEQILEETGIDSGQYGEAINKLAEEKPAYRKAATEAKQRLQHLVAQTEAVLEGQKVLREFEG